MYLVHIWLNYVEEIKLNNEKSPKCVGHDHDGFYLIAENTIFANQTYSHTISITFCY